MDPRTAPRQPFLVTSSPERAEEWARVLNEAGVDALVAITDAQTGDPGRSPLIGAIGSRPSEFVQLILIPPAERERAAAALLEAGWDGREGLRGGRGPSQSTPVATRRLTFAILGTVGAILVVIALRAVISAG